MASRCNPAAPRPSAASARRPSSRCRARRIRRFAAWWTLVLPVLDRLSGRRAAQDASTCRWRARLPRSVGIAEIVLLERKRRRHGCTLAVGRIVAGGDRPRRCLARGARRLRRLCGGQRRSMPICCGTDMSSEMTHTPTRRDASRHRSGPVPDHSVARGCAGAFRGGVVSARGAERTASDSPMRSAARWPRTWWRRSTCRRSTAPMSTALRCVRPISPPPARPRRCALMLNDEVIACGIAPTRPVAVGDGDADRNRRSGAARRRRRRDGRAYAAGGPPRDRDSPRRFARAIRVLCRLRHRARRGAAARRHRHRLARDRHAGGLRHRRS